MLGIWTPTSVRDRHWQRQSVSSSCWLERCFEKKWKNFDFQNFKWKLMDNHFRNFDFRLDWRESNQMIFNHLQSLIPLVCFWKSKISLPLSSKFFRKIQTQSENQYLFKSHLRFGVSECYLIEDFSKTAPHWEFF